MPYIRTIEIAEVKFREPAPPQVSSVKLSKLSDEDHFAFKEAEITRLINGFPLVDILGLQPQTYLPLLRFGCRTAFGAGELVDRLVKVPRLSDRRFGDLRDAVTCYRMQQG